VSEVDRIAGFFAVKPYATARRPALARAHPWVARAWASSLDTTNV
jgi:hypothetical protein